LARKIVNANEHYARAVASDLSEWAAPKNPGKKRSSTWNRDEVRAQLAEMIRTDNFVVATPKHFVELFCRMHEQVYGVPDLEMTIVKKAMIAAVSCKRVMKKYFEDDPRQMAEYMRWVWTQQHYEQVKRKNRNEDMGVIGFRVSARYQWSEGLITQYRRVQLTHKVERIL
jgi:hypothetical protein